MYVTRYRHLLKCCLHSCNILVNFPKLCKPVMSVVSCLHTLMPVLHGESVCFIKGDFYIGKAMLVYITQGRANDTYTIVIVLS